MEDEDEESEPGYPTRMAVACDASELPREDDVPVVRTESRLLLSLLLLNELETWLDRENGLVRLNFNELVGRLPLPPLPPAVDGLCTVRPPDGRDRGKFGPWTVAERTQRSGALYW